MDLWKNSACTALAEAICGKYPDNGPQSQSFRAMSRELNIKCRGYTMINKVAFWLAVACSLALIIWPVAVAYLLTDIGAAKAAILQTAITAFLAGAGVFYTTYKGKQTKVEGLLRLIAYSEDAYGDVEKTIRETMEKVDMGFDFSSLQKKSEERGEGDKSKVRPDAGPPSG